MSESTPAHFDYGALVADGADWSPEPEGEERDGFNLRIPRSLLAKVRAAAEVESKVWRAQGKHGDVSVNGLIVFALKRYFAEYEKAHGELALPADRTTKGWAKAVADKGYLEKLEKYASGIAKKRQAKEN